MARKADPLTDTKIKNTKSDEKDCKLFDGGGLFLLIKKYTEDSVRGKPERIKRPGSKLWRLKYLFEGKEKLLSLGTYPETSLAEARAKRDEHKKEIAKGIDPSVERKEIKSNIEVQKIENEALKSGQFHLVTYGWLDTLTNDETTMTA